MSQTVLELDDTNEDAQTFANLAASRVSASIDHLDNEGSIVADTSPPTEAKSERLYEDLSDTTLIGKLDYTIVLLREQGLRSNNKDVMTRWLDLFWLDAESELRDLGAWESFPVLKEDVTSILTSVAGVRALQQLTRPPYSSLDPKEILQRNQKEPESDYWRKRQGLAPLVVKQPSVVKQPGEPESDYWRKRQGLAPLRNQASGTSSSSDSPPQQEESGGSGVEMLLRFIGGILGAVVGVILMQLIFGVDVSGGGGLVMRLFGGAIGIAAGSWLFGKFKS